MLATMSIKVKDEKSANVIGANAANFELVAELGNAYTKGLSANNIIGIHKHLHWIFME
jgi:beta-glucosidase-like glycosyl hydrolase